MEHLTIEEMIDFVMIDKMNAESIALASKVTTHMRGCEACMRKVRAFGLVYDELKRLGRKKEAHSVLEDMTEQTMSNTAPKKEQIGDIR